MGSRIGRRLFGAKERKGCGQDRDFRCSQERRQEANQAWAADEAAATRTLRASPKRLRGWQLRRAARVAPGVRKNPVDHRPIRRREASAERSKVGQGPTSASALVGTPEEVGRGSFGFLERLRPDHRRGLRAVCDETEGKTKRGQSRGEARTGLEAGLPSGGAPLLPENGGERPVALCPDSNPPMRKRSPTRVSRHRIDAVGAGGNAGPHSRLGPARDGFRSAGAAKEPPHTPSSRHSCGCPALISVSGQPISRG
jgi:hypothetical protein